MLVESWLAGIGLSYSIPSFQANGVTVPDKLSRLVLNDFDALGVTDTSDRQKLFYLVQRVRISMEKKRTNHRRSSIGISTPGQAPPTMSKKETMAANVWASVEDEDRQAMSIGSHLTLDTTSTRSSNRATPRGTVAGGDLFSIGESTRSVARAEDRALLQTERGRERGLELDLGKPPSPVAARPSPRRSHGGGNGHHHHVSSTSSTAFLHQQKEEIRESSGNRTPPASRKTNSGASTPQDPESTNTTPLTPPSPPTQDQIEKAKRASEGASKVAATNGAAGVAQPTTPSQGGSLMAQLHRKASRLIPYNRRSSTGSRDDSPTGTPSPLQQKVITSSQKKQSFITGIGTGLGSLHTCVSKSLDFQHRQAPDTSPPPAPSPHSNSKAAQRHTNIYAFIGPPISKRDSIGSGLDDIIYSSRRESHESPAQAQERPRRLSTGSASGTHSPITPRQLKKRNISVVTSTSNSLLHNGDVVADVRGKASPLHLAKQHTGMPPRKTSRSQSPPTRKASDVKTIGSVLPQHSEAEKPLRSRPANLRVVLGGSKKEGGSKAIAPELVALRSCHSSAYIELSKMFREEAALNEKEGKVKPQTMAEMVFRGKKLCRWMEASLEKHIPLVLDLSQKLKALQDSRKHDSDVPAKRKASAACRY